MASRRTEGPPPERTFWELLPRRNVRRALLLVAALIAVIALQRSSGKSFRTLFEDMAPLGPGASGSADSAADKRRAGAAASPFSPMKVVTPAARSAAGGGGAPP